MIVKRSFTEDELELLDEALDEDELELLDEDELEPFDEELDEDKLELLDEELGEDELKLIEEEFPFKESSIPLNCSQAVKLKLNPIAKTNIIHLFFITFFPILN